MGNPDYHVPQGVVDVSARRDEAGVFQELPADRAVEQNGVGYVRHGFLLGFFAFPGWSTISALYGRHARVGVPGLVFSVPRAAVSGVAKRSLASVEPFSEERMVRASRR